MSDFVADGDAIRGAAQEIMWAGRRIHELALAHTFATLGGAFDGATDPFRDAAAHGDTAVTSGARNAGDGVTSFGTTVIGFAGMAESVDATGAAQLREITALPSATVVDPNNTH